MPEKTLIINNRELRYKGIFRVEELFSTINRAIEARKYVKREKKTEETVSEYGKRTFIEIRPFKNKTNYGQLYIKMRILLDGITDVTEEIKGVKKVFQQGDVTIFFDAWVYTDYGERWGMKPWAYFLKGLINKYIYTTPIEAGFGGEVSSDTAYIYSKIKKLLNSYTDIESKFVSEEEVKKEIAKEIKQPD